MEKWNFDYSEISILPWSEEKVLSNNFINRAVSDQKNTNIPKQIFLLLILVQFLTNCNAQTSGSPGGECQFANPVFSGADPWIVEKDGEYFYSESSDGGIYISTSEYITGIKSQSSQVWQPPDEGWNASNLWAPEIHFLRGNWFIYYTAGESGPPFIHQRSGVLRAITDDPLGEYEDMGMLYTGDDIETGKDSKWAIDLTVLEHNAQLYAIWSGWEENANTDRTPQHLYIAEMDNPWTISSNRVKISSPEESWEKGTELAINEGPQVLQNETGEVFIIYSASESWLPAYNLGQLPLVSKDGDPMNPDNWIKSGSVFEGSGQVFGTGHASFTLSPDGSEHWVLYHTKTSPEPGWDRVIHAQPFTWNTDGAPDFGKPAQPDKKIDKPSGECE